VDFITKVQSHWKLREILQDLIFKTNLRLISWTEFRKKKGNQRSDGKGPGTENKNFYNHRNSGNNFNYSKIRDNLFKV